MKRITHLLFPVAHQEEGYALLLLLLRLLFGALLLSHGISKWIHFDALENTFPDPLGVGSRFSLMLTLFAEVFCAGFIILGLLTRPMAIPIIIAMFVALVVIHHGQPFAAKELSFIYLLLYIILMLFGPGRYSVDYVIGTMMHQQNTTLGQAPSIDK